MTSQEIFDFVIGQLIKQKVKSIKNERCMYRCKFNDAIIKCAFGHLIPDDCYHPDMEGCSALALIRNIPNAVSYYSYGYTWKHYVENNDWLFKNKGLITDLQNLHDGQLQTSAFDSEQFLIEAEDVARKNSLEFNKEKFI